MAVKLALNMILGGVKKSSIYPGEQLNASVREILSNMLTCNPLRTTDSPSHVLYKQDYIYIYFLFDSYTLRYFCETKTLVNSFTQCRYVLTRDVRNKCSGSVWASLYRAELVVKHTGTRPISGA